MTFEIRSGVPVPNVTRDSKYPWDQLSDGDSIVFAPADAQAASQSARLWVKRHRPEYSVVTRTLDSDGTTGVWFVLASDENDGTE